MHSKRFKSVLLVLSLCFGSTAVADVTDDVRCQEIAFSLAAENRDAEAFAALIDPDARFVGNSVMKGVEQIVTAWSAFFAEDGPTIKWRPQFVEVLQEGKLALTRGPYRMTSKDDEGNPVDHWGTFNSVWRLQDDGQWRVIFDAGSPSSEPPTDEKRQILESTCIADE
jgi:uncharacterized protein (TIGR02246 family)